MELETEFWTKKLTITKETEMVEAANILASSGELLASFVVDIFLIILDPEIERRELRKHLKIKEEKKNVVENVSLVEDKKVRKKLFLMNLLINLSNFLFYENW